MPDSWEKDVMAIHQRVVHEKGLSARMQLIAQYFCDRPYICNPLVGGPQQKEKMVIQLDAFDCVTFIETTLALARSNSCRGFLRELKKIRYREGKVEWVLRLHYFSQWMKNNQKRGTMIIRTRGPGSRIIEKRLCIISGLAPQRVRFDVVPKQKISQAIHRISNGTIVAFASLRQDLDFFHTGLLFCLGQKENRNSRLLLYHASKSAGKVTVIPLESFLEKNRMRGIAFAVPKESGGFP